jgi:hypothetical protein
MTQLGDGGPWTAADSSDGHAHVVVRSAWLDQWRRQFAVAPVPALMALVDEYGAERAVEVLASADWYESASTADDAASRARAVRAHLEVVLGDPSALRRIADAVECA